MGKTMNNSIVKSLILGAAIVAAALLVEINVKIIDAPATGCVQNKGVDHE